jgi:phosphatidyl-myo-inositol dimannoside synthase
MEKNAPGFQQREPIDCPMNGNPVKILFVSFSIYGTEGGIQRYNRRFLEVLSELTDAQMVHKVTAIVLWDSQAGRFDAPPQVDFIGCGSSKMKAVASFVTRLVKDKPDVVIFGHVLFAPLTILARLLVRRSRQVILVYGIDVWEKPNPLMAFLIRKYVWKIFSMSQFTANTMQDLYRLSGSKFDILPGAVDDVEETKERADVTLKGQSRLLSVTRLSRFDSYKNIDKVILAMPQILRRHPDTHYYIVGDGDWRLDLEGLVEAQKLGGNVHFMGELDDTKRLLLHGYYANSNIFILPSDKEGFGIVYLEAWSYHLPVIASRHGAAPEVVRNGIDGICVDPTPDQIAQAVIQLLSDKGAAARYGEAGNSRLKNNFTHKRFKELLTGFIFRND